MVFAALLEFTSIFISSYMTNFTLFTICFMFFGIADGLIFMIPIDAGYHFFPNKKGLVSVKKKSLNNLKI